MKLNIPPATKTKPYERPRYVNLEPEVASRLDELVARTGHHKFWLANYLLKFALDNVADLDSKNRRKS